MLDGATPHPVMKAAMSPTVTVDQSGCTAIHTTFWTLRPALWATSESVIPLRLTRATSRHRGGGRRLAMVR